MRGASIMIQLDLSASSGVLDEELVELAHQHLVEKRHHL